MIQRHISGLLEIQALKLKQVIFDDSDTVCLTAEARLNENVQNVSLMFTFKQFNDFMRFMGEESEQIQLLISDALSANEKGATDQKAPYCISLQNENTVVTSIKLNISPLSKVDKSTYAVAEIQPLSRLQQARNVKKNMRDFKQSNLSQRNTLKDELMKIARMYRYYKGLLELNFTEVQARQQAGLENDKLFELAWHTSL